MGRRRDGWCRGVPFGAPARGRPFRRLGGRGRAIAAGGGRGAAGADKGINRFQGVIQSGAVAGGHGGVAHTMSSLVSECGCRLGNGGLRF